MQIVKPPPKPRSSRLDFGGYSEATRQAIYDHVIREYFTRQKVDGVDWDPLYEPAQAQLQVLFLFGRWLVTWWRLDEPQPGPERVWRALLLAEPDERGRIALREL